MAPRPRTPAPTVDELLVHRGWVEGLARRLVRDPSEADDVAQQAWVRVLSRPPTPRTSPRAWLAAVVRSCAVDRWRSDSTRAARERAAPPAGSAPPTADLVARADAHRRLLEEVLRLEPVFRDAVLLRFFEGLSPDDIARRLGEPGGTVRSRLHRAIAELRDRLDRAHGGDRAAWAVAILGPAASAPIPVPLEEAVAMGARTKAAAVAAAALLLIAGGVAAFRAAGEPAPPPALASPPVAAAPPAPAEEPPPAPEAAAQAPVSPAPVPEPASAALAPAAPAAPASGFVRLATTALAPREPDPPPPGFEGAAIGAGGAGAAGPAVEGDDDDTGRGAGFGFVGWTRWKPVKPTGTATLRGRVVDLQGRPLPGATILEALDPPYVDVLGTAGDDGRFEFARKPARAYRLFPEYCGTVRDAEGRIPDGVIVLAEPREGETVRDIVLRVPVDRERFGSIAGRVIDEEGRPARVSVGAGTQGAECDADGRFRFASVPEGEVRVSVDEYGWKPWARTVAVRRGAETEIEIPLAISRAGTQEIGGVVRDDAGKPVPGAKVWCGGPFGVSRSVTADADGAFLFRRLPTPKEDESFTVSVFDFGPGEHEPFFPRNVDGIRPPARNVVVELERTALLRIVVTDAPSGEVLPLFNVALEREVREDGEAKTVRFGTATLHEEDGAWEATVPRTRVVLFVEAPDHVPSHLAVEIPKGEGRWEVAVPLAR